MSRRSDFSRACLVRPARAALAVVAFVGGGCVLFNPNPPLPKHGVIETAATPRAPDEFAQVVERAEVFYVPADRTGWALRQESGWKLIEALRRTGSFAIGWGAIGSEQQPMLDELLRGGSGSAEGLSRVTFLGTQPERERSRELLRQTHVLGVSQLALHCPGEIVEKLRRRELLTPAERAAFPAGFAVPGSEHQPESDEPARTIAFSSRFIAEKIVQRLGAHPGEKLLVFLDRAELENSNGVPFFVAQKSSVRQLVLESNQPSESRARLLTRNESGAAPHLLEVENRPPGS
ncbi:MAG: hypothetical protein M3Z64_12100 [Verrucomicrobiota bacterium]|nr:hypothetical protein [Verrucomicrobiota bacterium]